MPNNKAETPELIKHFRAHKGPITSLSFNPVTSQLASAGQDECVMLWSKTSRVTSLKFIARKLPITCVNFSPKGDVMAASQGPYVRMWIPTVHGRSSEFKAHSSVVRSVQFSCDGLHLVTASDDKVVKMWAVSRTRFLNSFVGHTNWVRAAKFSKDGSMLVSCSDDKSIKLWDVRSGKEIHTFYESTSSPTSVEFHPSGACIGAGLSSSVVKIYDLKERKVLQYYMHHESSVNSIAFHPTGHFLISASSDTTSMILDLVESRPLFTMRGHQAAVTAVAFTEDGDRFATGSADKEVLVWRTNLEDICEEEGKELRLEQSVTNNESTPPSVVATISEAPSSNAQVEEVYSASNYQEVESAPDEPSATNYNQKEYSKDLYGNAKGDSCTETYDSAMVMSDLKTAVLQTQESIRNMDRRMNQLETQVSRLIDLFTNHFNVSN